MNHVLRSFSNLNDLLGKYVPEHEQTIQAEKDWNAVYNFIINNGGWIWCSEEMPPYDEEVNVWLDYARRQVATMSFVGYDDIGDPIWNWHNSDDRTMLNPKAWQPLPKPPMEDK